MSVVSWARRQFERPLSDAERRTALTVIAVVLIAMILLVATLSTGVPASRPAPDRHGDASPASADRQGPPPASRAALRTARRFLEGYLAFVYGHGPVREVKDATPNLTITLEQSTRPVPPELRALHPRVLALKTHTAPGAMLAVTALVKDGEVLTYPIRIVLAVRGGRYLVTGLGGA